MYVVVFNATISKVDRQYNEMATLLRERAFSEYGCQGFHAVTEGNKEIAVSYWPSLDAIKAWKDDLKHSAAQSLGKGKWYLSYQIDVAKVERTTEYPIN